MTQTSANLISNVDEVLIAAALEHSDLNAVRLALYQITGDSALAKMRVERQPVWGGVFNMIGLAPEHHSEVKKRATTLLLDPPANFPPPHQIETATRLMEMFCGEKLTENELRFGTEELAFDDFPREVKWSRPPTAAVLDGFHVTIVGSGISGIVIAIMLARLGIPYTIIEREAGIGGTWLINSYPDCRVDIPAHLYQFKFEKNYPWSEYYPSRGETLKYLQHIAVKFGIMPHVKFRSEVTAATWNEQSAKWHVKIKRQDGVEQEITSNVIFNASGQFAKPNFPDIEGIKTFKGAMFHTTSWDHSFDCSGKRVALIGNGATGTQLMPSIAKIARRLTVFQRTPQWIISVDNYRAKIPQEIQYLFDNLPYYWNWFCYSTFVRTYEMQKLTVYDREWQAQGGIISERNDKLREVLIKYIREKVHGDETQFRKLLPPFPPLARRMLVDNGWYDALARENVDLVCDGIARFTSNGIVTTDGVERSVDLVILGAGFQVSKYMWPIEYVGRDGMRPSDVWKRDGARAYLSMMMPYYPNFFMFYGPNAQPRAGGFHSWAETWARYAIRIVVHMLESGASSFEVRQAAYDDYNRRLDKEAEINLRGPASVGSYYLNEFGRAGVNVPWLAEDWHAMLAEPNFEHFDVRF
jgi:4-hydroxyacetophenone monooxygenase